MTAPADDSRLVAAALAGDRGAFGALAGRHRSSAEALARRLLRDPVEAEDVVQEAILRAYLGLAELRDPARFGPWLCGIALNLGRMRLRRLARSAPLPADLEAAAARDELGSIRDALAVLSPAQREVVVMHYVVGLSGREIADLLGRSPGAVRVQLHRARERLRETLPPPTRKESEMIELTVEDVLAQHDAEHPGDARVILLRERDGDRRLPIWVGSPEGNALALHLGSELPLRPLTIDLAARLLEAAGGRVERVSIGRLHEEVFYASVDLGGQEVDARPSDALNLAVRVDAPIFVDGEVLDQAGFAGEDLAAHLAERTGAVLGEAAASAGEWQSLSAAEVKRLHTPPGPLGGKP